jgi:hypothetical protein
VIERGAPAGEHEVDLEVGDDVGRGQELEAVEAVFGDLADLEGGLGFSITFDEAAGG